MGRGKTPEVLNQVSNDANDAVMTQAPYIVNVQLSGACPVLFHRWSCDEVEAKAKAAKNSAAKKTDNLESFVYRDLEGFICLPGEYLRMAVVAAAKFIQDPRSPRKSGADLFKAGVVAITDLAPINGGVKEWEFVDRRRVMIQRNGITRLRPGFQKGWSASVDLQIVLPEYIEPSLLRQVLDNAGRVIGVADFRPTFGRFTVDHFEVLNLQ